METKDSLKNLPEHFEHLTEKQQEILLDWCSMIKPTIKINYDHTSYGMKPMFEHYADGFYITNGQLKGAMIKCGFKHEPIGNGLHWFFNISHKSFTKLINLNRGI